MSCLAEIPALLCFGFVLLSFASTGDTQNSTSSTESTSSTAASTESTSLTTAKDGNTQNYTSPTESTSSTKSATSQESTSPTTAKADIKTECVACVYTYAANGTTDYSCVSDPFSHALSRNVTCNFTSQSCIITILYDTPDSEHIRSMERKCDFTKNQSIECDPYTPSTCQSECRTNFCNTYSVVTRNLTSFSTSTKSTASTQYTPPPTTGKADIKTECVACTYNYAGDGTIDYACVSDPFSLVSNRIMSCNFTSHSCIIRVVYKSSDFKQIQSLVRGCEPTKNQNYECDAYDPPTCLRECRSNFCNSIFGDIKNPPPSTVTNGADIKTECVACTYNYSGDGTIDYACVSDPFSLASNRNMTCNFTSQSCIIRVVYELPDFKKIQSLVRGCEPTKNQNYECDTHKPATCLRECRSNFCNSIFGDIKNPPPSTVTNGGIRPVFFGILFLCLGLQPGL